MNRPWEDTFSVEEIREYIRKLSDEDLLRYGRAARYMTTPEATRGKPPRQVFLVQLEECRAEWKRRFKAKADETTARE
jgi:hypothetical protein